MPLKGSNHVSLRKSGQEIGSQRTCNMSGRNLLFRREERREEKRREEKRRGRLRIRAQRNRGQMARLVRLGEGESRRYSHSDKSTCSFQFVISLSPPLHTLANTSCQRDSHILHTTYPALPAPISLLSERKRYC
jgi:hypothetical protein